MFSNKKLNQIVTEIFFGSRKLKHFSCFYNILFCCTKKITLNSTPYFIIKIPNKQGLQLIGFNHSSNNELKDFIDLYKICTEKPCSFVVIDATHGSDNPSHFTKHILERI